MTKIMNEINGHEYVDLGLSVKWATCNVGASSPKEHGDYFAWGETSPKSTYDKEGSKTYSKSGYEDIAGDASLDAARANWGGTWRLPTEAEMEELEEECTWMWTSQNGVNGYKVTNKMNGNSIFLPAAGHRDGASLNCAGEDGNYWASTPHESDASLASELKEWHDEFRTNCKNLDYDWQAWATRGMNLAKDIAPPVAALRVPLLPRLQRESRRRQPGLCRRRLIYR